MTAPANSAAATNAPHYVGTWSTTIVPLTREPQTPPCDDTLLIQNVRVSVGGPQIRLRLSNAFGESALVITSASLSLLRREDCNAAAATAQHTPLSFAGQSGLTIPAGGTAMSDTVDFALPAMADLVISLRIKEAPRTLTGHTTPSFSRSFHRAAQADNSTTYKRVNGWYFINGIDVAGSTPQRAVVLLGDSITDGCMPPSSHLRWTDELSRRLRANPATANVGVLNQGLGGNRILNDGNGIRAIDRLERDVLTQSGVRWLVIFIGVNDLGQATYSRAAGQPAPSTAEFIAAYKQMTDRAHALDIKVYGATVLPFKGAFYWSEQAEEQRLEINTWIRGSGTFDAVLDFDASLCEPDDHSYLAEKYDSGDYLHPNSAGLKAIGSSVDLALFEDE